MPQMKQYSQLFGSTKIRSEDPGIRCMLVPSGSQDMGHKNMWSEMHVCTIPWLTELSSADPEFCVIVS